MGDPASSLNSVWGRGRAAEREKRGEERGICNGAKQCRHVVRACSRSEGGTKGLCGAADRVSARVEGTT